MDADGFLIEGLALPWNSLSCQLTEKGKRFRERFLPYAFSAFLGFRKEVEVLINHNNLQCVAKLSEGTLSLVQTDEGLRLRIDPGGSFWRHRLHADISSHKLRGLSVSIRVTPDDYVMMTDPCYGPVRFVHRASLAEVSIVDRPAYSATSLRLVPAPPKRLRELQREVNRGDFEGDTSAAHFRRATELDLALADAGFA